MTPDSIKAMLKEDTSPFSVLLSILEKVEESDSLVRIMLDQGDSSFMQIEFSSRGMYFDDGGCIQPEDIGEGLSHRASTMFKHHHIDELQIEIEDQSFSRSHFLIW